MTETPHDPEPASGPMDSTNDPASVRRQRWIAAGLAVLLVALVAITALVFNRPQPASAPAPTETATPTQTPTETPTPTPTPEPTPTEEPEPPRSAMNILLIGSDIRGIASTAENERAATGKRPDHRADALMVIHVPADRHAIYGFSMMRDLWVNIPGYGGAKINSSLDIGGVPLVTQTVSTLLNSPIHHTVMADFAGFKGLTDVLGGVEVDVRIPFTATSDERHYFPAGVQTLNGQMALEFVRERYAFSDGDYQRVRNQQNFLRSVLFKVNNTASSSDPAAARRLVAMLSPFVTVDQSWDAASLAWLAFSLRTVPPQNVFFFTLPTAGTGFSADGQSIVVQNPAATAEVGAALAAGRLGDYIGAHGFAGGN
jgi:LCP family protein required for cell wall assembly